MTYMDLINNCSIGGVRGISKSHRLKQIFKTKTLKIFLFESLDNNYCQTSVKHRLNSFLKNEGSFPVMHIFLFYL